MRGPANEVANEVKIELFLSPVGDRGQTLARGLGTSAIDAAAEVDAATTAASGGALPIHSFDPSGDPSSLRDQGWGVIAPRGEDGDRLLAMARPLLDRRAADQDGEVPVYRVAPDMTAAAAAAWIDRKLVENARHDTIPGYLLVLGRPDEVSFELQQVLASAFQVGRVGFDADAGYEAYIDKLLRAERAPPRPPRAVYFTARDGTPATEIGRRLLMQPCIADAEQQRDAGRFARDITIVEDDDPARAADRLLAAAADPGVIFTCSHGAGAPTGGWASAARRRALQGALCLGGDQRLEADAVARARFAPGGIWVMFACFGAGTPRQSAYEPFLRRLQQEGEHDDDLAAVLASLPADGEPPFLAALPQAALANPDGPLAIVGHLDLAWSYSFQDLEKMSRGERHRRFHELVALLVRGTPIGLALGGSLMRARNQVQTEVAIAAADDARAGERPEQRDRSDQRARLGHRWMVMQDLDGYIALGDPAARLLVDDASRPAARSISPAAVEIRSAASELAAATASSASISTRSTAAGATGAISVLDPAAIQTAIYDLIAERATPADVAARLGVDTATVTAWHRAYTETGLRAVLALIATAREPREPEQ
jgi:hypothetical protein